MLACFQKWFWLLPASALPDDIQAVWRTVYTRTYSSQAARVTSPYLPQGERLANWLQAMLQFLPSSPGNDQRPFLFSRRDNNIYLSILDSSILPSWAPCTLLFPELSLSDFQDVANIFRPNTHSLKKSGQDSRNSTEEKAELLSYPQTSYQHLNFYSPQIHLIT